MWIRNSISLLFLKKSRKKSHASRMFSQEQIVASSLCILHPISLAGQDNYHVIGVTEYSEVQQPMI